MNYMKAVAEFVQEAHNKAPRPIIKIKVEYETHPNCFGDGYDQLPVVEIEYAPEKPK